MIILFLLCMYTIHLQASHNTLTPPYTQRYMSMSRQELQQKKAIIQQELADTNKQWHQEKVCGITRNAIGMSAVGGIVLTGMVVGTIMLKIPTSIMVPCVSGTAIACDHCYQPDQSKQKTALQEVNRALKLKID